jgi:uncharacterized paraquat-inducible protein A
MSCEHLICAQCAGPVSEGRCPVCRVARSQVHHHHHGSAQALLVAGLILLLLMAVLLQHVAH